MKVYFANGSYFETQAEAKAEAKSSGTGFEVVDFPFGATPKADFIGWLNNEGRHFDRIEITGSATEVQISERAVDDLIASIPKLDVRAGPPTPAVIAVDREQRAERLDRISVEEEIQSCDLPRLATLASNVAWRFNELAKLHG